MLEIIVKKKRDYGQERIYPVCRTAELFCSLTGKQTFSTADLVTIKALGYNITLKPQTLEITG